MVFSLSITICISRRKMQERLVFSNVEKLEQLHALRSTGLIKAKMFKYNNHGTGK